MITDSPHKATKNPRNTELFRHFPPDITALRAMWRTLRDEQDAAPAGCRLGVAIRRTALLATFPSREIPDIIDRLNESEEVFA